MFIRKIYSQNLRLMNQIWKKRWKKVLSEPFVHFALLGGLLYLLYINFSKPDPETIIITKQKIEDLHKVQEQKLGRPPGTAERQQFLDKYIDDEVLLREAYKQGFDQSDPYIRKRMIDKMKFSLYDNMTPPGNKVLLEYYENHKEKYASGIKISFEQVYFTKVQYDTLKDKDGILSALNEGTAPGNFGTVFPGGNKFENRSQMELIPIFGTSFVTAIGKFPVGKWHGPVTSKRGIHFVRITDKQITGYLPFEVIKPVVLNDYIQQEQQAELQHKIDSLKAGYKILIEPS